MRGVLTMLLAAAMVASTSGITRAGVASVRSSEASASRSDSLRWSSFLPLLKGEAEKRGIELPLPFGVGLVYYHLDRDVEITDVRVGRNGSPPASIGDFAQLSARSEVDNLNLKLDVWLFPFLNLYLIGGYVWNETQTTMDVTIPPLAPGGPPRMKRLTFPAKVEGSVAGVGLTLAAGYGPFFMSYDANFAQADLGFDDRFKAVVSSIRGGWHGRAGSRPLRVWANATDWNTFATAAGTIADPDGGTLSFQVDQGPAYRYTYGVGGQYGLTRRWEFAADAGFDGHGGWYVALVPVFRF